MSVMPAVRVWGFFALLCCVVPGSAAEPALPAVGGKAADFELLKIDGTKVQLAAELKQGPVVLMVLRGYPGYQCPICSVQVGQFIGKAKELAELKTRVIMVYPGPGTDLNKRAQEFMKETKLPENVDFVLDPDYVFTNQYHLRWDQPRETAYPATFVIDPAGKIVFAKISKTHGDRAKVADVLKAIPR